MTIKRIISLILKLVVSFSTLMIFVAVDYFSIGGNLFKIEGIEEEIPNTLEFSSYIFLATTFVSQAIYSLFSSINTGICSSIIFETFTFSQKIANVCYKTLMETLMESNLETNVENNFKIIKSSFYLNVMICMGVSTLIFAILSLLPYFMKSGNYLNNIPMMAVYSFMAAIGVGLYMEAIGDNLSFEFDAMMNIGIYTLFGFFMLLLEIIFPSFSFLIPVSALVIVAVFNIYFRFIKNVEPAVLVSAKLIISNSEGDCDFMSLFKNSVFNYRCILNNASNIFSMVLSNLIHININLHPYIYATNQSIDFDKEWRTQALSNFFTAFTGYPSYFISSTSIFFYKSGASNRFASMLGAFVPVVLGIISPYIRNWIPNAMAGIVISYLGMSFLYNYYFRLIRIISRTDFLIMTIGLVLGKANSYITGFATVIAMACIIIIKYVFLNKTNKNICNMNSKDSMNKDIMNNISKDSTKMNNISKDIMNNNNIKSMNNIIKSTSIDYNNDNYIIIDHVFSFMSVPSIRNKTKNINDKITFDLSLCSYIDMNANFLLEDIAQNVKEMIIIGKPDNLYISMLEQNENIIFV